jgi:hypothetical protein
VANSTLLQLFQSTMQGMGIATYGLPASVIGNTGNDTVQTLALVNAAGRALAREHDWQYLQTQYNFTATTYSYTGTTTLDSTSITGMSSIANLDSTFMLTGIGVAQDTFVVSASSTTVVMSRAATATGSTTLTFSKVLFSPPADFDRPIDRTHWDKSKHWEMLGPSTPQQQEWLRSGYISTGPRIRFWMKGGYFQIWPPLGSTESLEYEYLSKYWVLATGATAISKSAFSVDTDTCIFPDPLIEALIRLKYFEVKGFDTTALKLDYDAQLDIAKAADGGSPTLSMAPRISTVLIGWENIPDSNYGS